MRILGPLLGVTVLGGSLFALALAPVPPGHTGTRDAERLAPGLHLHAPQLFEVVATPEGAPTLLGRPGTEPPVRVETASGAVFLDVAARGPVDADALRAALAKGLADADAATLRDPRALRARVRKAAAPVAADLLGVSRPPALAARDLDGHLQHLIADAAERQTRLGARAEARRQAAEAEEADLAARAATEERTRAALRAEAEAEAARLVAEADAEAARLLAQAEADRARAAADAELALARAEADRDARLAAALSGEGARYHAAIEAARRFELGDTQLETQDPEFLRKFGSMEAWRRFFLGDR